MLCRNCQKELPDTMLQCPYCGADPRPRKRIGVVRAIFGWIFFVAGAAGALRLILTLALGILASNSVSIYSAVMMAAPGFLLGLVILILYLSLPSIFMAIGNKMMNPYLTKKPVNVIRTILDLLVLVGLFASFVAYILTKIS